MKIVREDGRITYYYYKKKRGRKKKRGPKKKVEKKEKLSAMPFPYSIVRCVNKVQKGSVCKCRTLEEVTKVLSSVAEHNKGVLCPVKSVNNKESRKRAIPYTCEYVVLKRRTKEDEETFIRNEYGRLVRQVTNSGNWVIVDKVPYLIEETFSIYSPDNGSIRKDIGWIGENLLEACLNAKYSRIRIICYNNKIIFKYDDNEIEFFQCKNVSDAIRAYSALYDKYSKYKGVMFYGKPRQGSILHGECINDIKKKTGWTLNKIYKKSTVF